MAADVVTAPVIIRATSRHVQSSALSSLFASSPVIVCHIFSLCFRAPLILISAGCHIFPKFFGVFICNQ